MAFTKKPTTNEEIGSLGSQAWNSADIYSKVKISRLLIQLDLDEEIAIFGRKDEQDEVPNEHIPYRRIEYFHKFIFHLKQLIGNCKFAIGRGYDEKVINSFGERIEQIEEVIDGISSTFVNEVTKEEQLKINEKHFKTCFKILQEIKDDLNFPLNRASLIFRASEELDLDAIMRNIEDGG